MKQVLHHPSPAALCELRPRIAKRLVVKNRLQRPVSALYIDSKNLLCVRSSFFGARLGILFDAMSHSIVHRADVASFDGNETAT